MSQNPNWYVAAKQHPVVTGLIVLSAMGGMLVSLSYPTAARYFSFAGLNGEPFWRLITPMFLHFGIVHFIFNSLWLSMLGSRIERLSGSIHLILLVLISGLVSNLAQFWWSGAANFGGMSGVVYALLGYIWIAHKIVPRSITALPKGIVGFMIGWLILCMTPVLTFLLGVGIANAAHLGGLIIGMFLGLLFGVVARFRRKHEL